MPQLDLNDIRIFVIVSQAGTFSAAAKKAWSSNLDGKSIHNEARAKYRSHAL